MSEKIDRNRIVVDFTADAARETSNRIADDFVALAAFCVLTKFGYEPNFSVIFKAKHLQGLLVESANWQLDNGMTVFDIFGHPELLRYFLSTGVRQAFQRAYESEPEKYQVQSESLDKALATFGIDLVDPRWAQTVRNQVETSVPLLALVGADEHVATMSAHIFRWLQSCMEKAISNPDIAALITGKGHFQLRDALLANGDFRFRRPSDHEPVVEIVPVVSANKEAGLALLKSDPDTALGTLLALLSLRSKNILAAQIVTAFNRSDIQPPAVLDDDDFVEVLGG